MEEANEEQIKVFEQINLGLSQIKQTLEGVVKNQEELKHNMTDRFKELYQANPSLKVPA